jgi:glycosyltransferase involved in cell wall biosynthesis
MTVSALILELLKVVMSNRTAFVSMCARDSAIWFSFTGLYHAFEKYNVNVDFYFPSIKDDQDEYNNQVFYYDLKHPFLTLRSVYRLSNRINKDYSKVVIFSQGLFPAILTFLLNNNIEKISWVHEFGDYLNRTGLFRGVNYYLSDKYMQTKVKRIIVSSHEMVDRLSRYCKREMITFAHLPLSGDFSRLLDSNSIVDERPVNKMLMKAHPFYLVFFGGISPYKGLDKLQRVLDAFNDDDIHLTILGRGDLSTVAPKLYQRFIDNRNVDWCDDFMEAQDVADYLLSADLLYLFYSSVTATSLIDISNAFGLPVFCSKLPYFEQKVTNFVNGIVIDESDIVSTLKNILSGEIKFSKKCVKEHFVKFSATRECVDSLISSKII